MLRLDGEERERIVVLGRDLTVSAADLAVRFGVSDTLIRKVWRTAGLSRPKERVGIHNGMFGRTHSAVAREKIRAASKRQFADPENRARASATTIAHLLANGTVPVSRVEHRVGRVLDIMGVKALPQYGVRDAKTGRYVACVDFFLPVRNAALEVNGTYWHADPRVYDVGSLTDAQRRTRRRYVKKCEQLKAAGIGLIEVWEADVERDAQEAVRSALEAV